MFMGNQARGPEAYMDQSAQMSSLAPTPGMAQSMQQQQNRGQMQYDGTINAYQTGNDGSYGDGSTGGWTG